MQVFELHFNPKAQEDVIYDSFIYEPENIYERNLGNLCMAGELDNALPQNSRFLDNLASNIKKEYYNKSQRSCEESLKESLRGANELLNREAKRGNVSWMGNLNFAVISLSGAIFSQDQWEIHFTKIGTLKILLIRGDQVVDIGKNLEAQEAESYPLKIFGNIVSGKLIQNDKIIILTHDLFDFVTKENLAKELASVSGGKEFKEILKKREKALSEISGICIFTILTSPESPKVKETFKKEKEKFSARKIFLSPFLNFVSKTYKSCLDFFNPVRDWFSLCFRTGLAISNGVKNYFKMPRPKLTVPASFSKFLQKLKKVFKIFALKKNLILIFLLALVLVCGFFIFKEERGEEIKLARKSLEETQALLLQAQNFLIFKNEEKANALLQEAWQKISAQTDTGAPLREEALRLKKSIEEELFPLNKLKNIEKPELAENQKLFEEKEDGFSEFRSHYYFLKPESGEILKCPSFDQNDGNCRTWLKEETKKATDAKSMAIDGNVWILQSSCEIDRYFAGVYKETLRINIFPFLENPTKIFTSPTLPYLYILEPEKNRTVILTKYGEIVSQYQSKKFDKLLDFAVSEDGNTIYLLNGSEVYQITSVLP